MAKDFDRTSPEIDFDDFFDFDFSRKGRGTYNNGEFVFKRGDEPYKGSAGKLRLTSRKSGDMVIGKLFSDLDGNGRFSKDELIFKGSTEGDGIYDRLNGSSGKIRWDYDDCTPCARMAFNFLSINPIGSERVDFTSVELPGSIPGLAIGDSMEAM